MVLVYTVSLGIWNFLHAFISHLGAPATSDSCPEDENSVFAIGDWNQSGCFLVF